CTTAHCGCAEDLADYRAPGIDGMGLWEYQLPEGRGDEALARFQDSGLTATFCFPNVPGVIYGGVLFSEPKDPRERLALLKSGIRRLARFRPLGVACLAGPPRGVGVAKARAQVVEALREAAYVAGEVNVRLALEVIRPGPGGRLASTVAEARALIADSGAPNIAVLIRPWHF